jgi:hypothetical protein
MDSSARKFGRQAFFRLPAVRIVRHLVDQDSSNHMVKWLRSRSFQNNDARAIGAPLEIVGGISVLSSCASRK